MNDRREFLKLCSVGLVSATAGSLSRTSRGEKDYLSEIKRVPIDATDGDEISGIVQSVANREILKFPAGTFRWSSEASVLVDDWGIQCQEDTIFEVPAGFGEDEQGTLLRTATGNRVADNYFLQNLTFDSPGRAAPQLTLGARNSATIDGLHYRMNGPLSGGSQGNGISVAVSNPGGSFRINDYWQFNNGDIGRYGSGTRIGIFVRPPHDGTIRLTNPILQGFPNNACYVSRHGGRVIIENGLLMNNNVSAVRVSGGVEVYDTTVVIDTDTYVQGEGQLTDGAHNTRGFWGDGDHPAAAPGGLVSGCSVILDSYERCTGLVNNRFENRSLNVKDTQFLANADIDGTFQIGNSTVECSNCRFDGTSERTTLGRAESGIIVGRENTSNPRFDPGVMPIKSYRNYDFDWNRTHPVTPRIE
ncbi:hypothetical protein [Halorarius litoreus]|uniref:hypothetical protein n=1 Tax=Halorarius litoreus TaxID=2962676 RepID=UPI0020CDC948|nr:hypothetical protein [Halorarius litoreus]